jgi:hypothetical protein
VKPIAYLEYVRISCSPALSNDHVAVQKRYGVHVELTIDKCASVDIVVIQVFEDLGEDVGDKDGAASR